MLDLKKIRENPEAIRQGLLKRLESIDFSELLDLDQKHRHLLQEVETLKAKKNQFNRLKSDAESWKLQLTEMKTLSERIQSLDQTIAELSEKIQNILIQLPNLPASDVPSGGKENNQVVRILGKQPHFSFPLQNHVDLVTQLNLINYPRGAHCSGNGFWIYTHHGAQLEWALLNFFIEEHLSAGYQFILPPHLLNESCGFVSGQFPKFQDEVFQLKDSSQFLIPTAETVLINLHAHEILSEKDLPKKYFSYTPCYRKEAGSYRSQERGMIRGHQFNKVELFQFCLPENSEQALQELIQQAEKLLQKLELHYRVVQLAAQDCSFAMGKTFDLEVWIPSMQDYKEVSSASHAYDYQARRGEIRVRRSSKTEYLHTLNASGLATSRLLPAILEQFQQADGSVLIPQALRKWFPHEKLIPGIL